MALTAVTSHDDFLLELGQAVGAQITVHPVESLEGALEALGNARRSWLLAIDARTLPQVRAAVDTVAERAPHATVLVFADTAETDSVSQSLKGSRVFALLPIPLDARKTQAVIEGAAEEASRRQTPAAPPAAPVQSLSSLVVEAAPPAPTAGADPQGPDPGKRRSLLIAAAAAAAALAVGATWHFVGRGGSAPTAAAPPAQTASGGAAPNAAAPLTPAPSAPATSATQTGLLTGKVDDLLEKGRLAMHERRFTDPAGDNALLYYRSAAAADPASAEAQDGLKRVAEVMVKRVEESVAAARFDEAAAALAALKSVAPHDARLANLEQRLYSAALGRAVSEGNTDRATALLHQAQQAGSLPAEQLNRWSREITHRQDEAHVRTLANLADERIREGRLDEGDDSAKGYLQQLHAAAPGAPITQRANHNLVMAYLRKARDAAVARNRAEQDRWMSEARALGLKPADLASFDREVADARTKAANADNDRLVQQARNALRDGRLTEPGQDNAAAYLAVLQASNPASSALPEMSRDLAGKLLQRARTSIGAGRNADADIAQARRWGADPRDIAGVQQAAQSAAQPAVDPAVLAQKLKRTNSIEPDYPAAAMTRKVNGSVIVSFTVDTRGATRDVQVVEASPPGVFESSAIAAVRRWRYAPVIVNGSAVEVPVKARVTFRLATDR